MNIVNYQICEQPEHESELLNMVCIDEQCQKRQLLCCYCTEDHQTCKTIALKRFTKQFSDQIKWMNQENQKYQHNDLILNFEKIEETMEYSHNLINDIFDKTKQAIIDAKKVVNQLLNGDGQKKNQSVLLQKFEQEPSQLNFKRLIDEIESFKPNSEKLSFLVKKQQQNQISQKNITNGKIYAQQYQSAANTFTEQFLSFHEVLRKNIQDFFINTPTRITEQDYNNSKPFDKFKSDTMFTSVSSINLNKQQEKQLMIIQDDKDKVEINEKVKQNMNKNNELIKVNEQKEQMIQKDIQDNKLNQQDGDKGLQLQKEKESDCNQIIKMCRYKKFKLFQERQELIKLISINKQYVGGLSKINFLIFDLSNTQIQGNISVPNSEDGNEYTDVAYLEQKEVNGYLYLATKQGFIGIYQKVGTQLINFLIFKKFVIDQPGILKILVNPIDQYLFSIGKSKIVKVLSLNTMTLLKMKFGLQNYPTAFYLDDKNIFIGGINFIQIWQYTTGNVIEWNNLEQKVTAFVSNQSKLIVSMVDKIQIYNKNQQNEFQLINEVSFGIIKSIQILNEHPFLIISYTEVSPSFITQYKFHKICIYNLVEKKPKEFLEEEYFLYCITEKYNGEEYCIMQQDYGWCKIYKFEETTSKLKQ